MSLSRQSRRAGVDSRGDRVTVQRILSCRCCFGFLYRMTKAPYVRCLRRRTAVLTYPYLRFRARYGVSAQCLTTVTCCFTRSAIRWLAVLGERSFERCSQLRTLFLARNFAACRRRYPITKPPKFAQKRVRIARRTYAWRELEESPILPMFATAAPPVDEMPDAFCNVAAA